ncbi:phage baseplate protein [Pseudomonas sp. QC2]|jgi:phage baseplate assembly protein W|uniref:GPW/gp25 family protein n=1 Tax=Pseudomonas sp. QC2 TaxID=2065822 RepID=UPI000C7D3B93|nr:GPW/gp25 family protein [Pseudomonas sp. QC2]PLR61155.1 phage baseplate protein [Pseudomonas sp. QC2]
MIGMDRHTGQPISGIAHLRQCIGDILSTPLGSRRERPLYGSKLRRYVDLPVNEGWKGAVQAEASRALDRWEPRLELERVQAVSVVGGLIKIQVTGSYEGENVLLEVSV